MTNIYQTGSKTRFATRKNKVYEKGRVCVEKGCDQILSQYNDRKECFKHHKFKTPRVRGRIDPRENQ